MFFGDDWHAFHVVGVVDVAHREAGRGVQRDAHPPDVALGGHPRDGTDRRDHILHLKDIEMGEIFLLTIKLPWTVKGISFAMVTNVLTDKTIPQSEMS